MKEQIYHAFENIVVVKTKFMFILYEFLVLNNTYEVKIYPTVKSHQQLRRASISVSLSGPFNPNLHSVVHNNLFSVALLANKQHEFLLGDLRLPFRLPVCL